MHHVEASGRRSSERESPLRRSAAALTKRGLAARDRLVLETLERRAVPVAVTMAGGYAHDDEDVVDIHFNTVAVALERFASIPAERLHEVAC